MIPNSLINKAMGQGLGDVKKVLESIHAYLEIQTRELIKMRYYQEGRDIDEDKVNSLIEKYQEMIK